jgi:regulatory protein
MRKLSQKSLENSALFYLKRYSSTKEGLRRVMERKIKRASREQEIPLEVKTWIEAVLEKCTNLGYINDQRYANSKQASLVRAGKSERAIKQQLFFKGVPKDQLKALVFDAEDEFEGALKQLKKKKPFDDFDSKKKAFASLARKGFSANVIQRAMKAYFDFVAGR